MSEPGNESPQVVVVDAEAIAVPQNDQRSLTDLVEQPALVMRIGSMIKQLLEEVRSSNLDEASRTRLREIHSKSIHELERITLPFTDAEVPTEAELRIAQAQLVGWLEGLFHGIQTALFAQQVQSRAAFEEMRRRALPAGSGAAPSPPGTPGPPGQPGPDRQGSTGQYL